MPWQNNLGGGGVYLGGTAYPMRKRYEIVQGFINTRSISQSARDNHIFYVTADKIINGFLQLETVMPERAGTKLDGSLKTGCLLTCRLWF